jgi:hypothetical protein
VRRNITGIYGVGEGKGKELTQRARRKSTEVTEKSTAKNGCAT